jgi:hypothetical protein
VRILEILARRVAHTVQGVYEPASGLLTRSARSRCWLNRSRARSIVLPMRTSIACMS